ncbi:dicarboxylate transporter/tellurite-resistance protein TehA [Paucibacter sp. R3-3]|uniref:Dicarboxylate transporter/tellurite-resistance protein TehA n=1 Tax=Roseateles agri TaxID=3098619 RepID=A0ABU5DSF5_9BURK|nr:dicarboxylate transporter/tellurite-resistance protein TehA [Paucibacter sp. R3-3]MDY0749079.1 dicarboxylate transporter/tellurite-resistance protein TehA [Paucibacter sp. R3-3]
MNKISDAGRRATGRYAAASLFGSVLGICGLGMAWRLAARIWLLPFEIGTALLVLAVTTWVGLLLQYGFQALRDWPAVLEELRHPITGGTPALVGISTLLIAISARADAPHVGAWIGVAGLAWHLCFSLWHTGTMWRGGLQSGDIAPTLYLPSVAGNFTGAGFLGSYGLPDWGWLFFGAGVFAWLSMESLVLQRIWHAAHSRSAMPTVGIQFAPPVVGGTALLLLKPDIPPAIILMLWGYSLFQMMVGLRLYRWLLAESYSSAYWSYTFGVASSAVCGCKLILLGSDPARTVGLLTFGFANLVVGSLLLRSAFDMVVRAVALLRQRRPVD